jgi:hypothetical protein
VTGEEIRDEQCVGDRILHTTCCSRTVDLGNFGDGNFGELNPRPGAHAVRPQEEQWGDFVTRGDFVCPAFLQLSLTAWGIRCRALSERNVV